MICALLNFYNNQTVYSDFQSWKDLWFNKSTKHFIKLIYTTTVIENDNFNAALGMVIVQICRIYTVEAPFHIKV